MGLELIDDIHAGQEPMSHVWGQSSALGMAEVETLLQLKPADLWYEEGDEPAGEEDVMDDL